MMKVDHILTIILISTVILAIGTVCYAITSPKMGDRFTEFYILDSDGRTDNYPTDIKLGSSSDIFVYVSNHEYESVNYTLKVNMDEDMLINKELVLNNNETWKRAIVFIPNKEGNNTKLEFLLFKENNFTTPYRELHLWVNVT